MNISDDLVICARYCNDISVSDISLKVMNKSHCYATRTVVHGSLILLGISNYNNQTRFFISFKRAFWEQQLLC